MNGVFVAVVTAATNVSSACASNVRVPAVSVAVEDRLIALIEIAAIEDRNFPFGVVIVSVVPPVSAADQDEALNRSTVASPAVNPVPKLQAEIRILLRTASNEDEVHRKE